MAANNRASARPVYDDRSSASTIERDSRVSPANVNNLDRPQPRLTELDRKEAAKNAAGASWWTLFALVLGAAAASIGGGAGARALQTQRVRTVVH